ARCSLSPPTPPPGAAPPPPPLHAAVTGHRHRDARPVAERQREPGNGVRDDDRRGEHHLRRHHLPREPPLRSAGLTLQGHSIAALAALLRGGGVSPVDLVRESLA